MKKIYVGNLAYSTTSEDLNNLFSKFGSIISANLIKDRLSGTSKGFAFVEMNDAKEASTAIQELNGISLGGRNLKVNEAIDLNSQPRRNDNSQSRRSDDGYRRNSRG